MQNLLVTGAAGFLGRYFCLQCPTDWRIIAWSNNTKIIDNQRIIEKHYFDISNIELLDTYLNKKPIDAILHLAAISDTNTCEKYPVLSNKVNVEVAKHLADFAAQKNIPLYFTSSSQIYDGKKAPYREDSEPNPLNLYGKQKLAAEQAILNENPKATILRMPLMYGFAPEGVRNFLMQWIRHFQMGKEQTVFTDEIRTVLSGREAARALWLIICRKLEGVWQVAGKEALSRYDMALLIAEVFDFDKNYISPCLQSSVQMAAERPANVSLDAQKFYAQGFEPNDMRAELEKIRKEMTP